MWLCYQPQALIELHLLQPNRIVDKHSQESAFILTLILDIKG